MIGCARCATIEIDTGGIVAPFSAFLVLRGIATLAVRMDRHCESALVTRALARGRRTAAIVSATRACPTTPRPPSRSASSGPAAAC